ncbi:hypothetical protein ASPWEDRAFT_166225 [Aspergillus wentii DTO 134E9]|uniref:Uncharacterized protein n=1 Tax=Aspergillus wentii DTO 134E9 TaxID=1073089 RepID=A0A1L9RYY2_ASPWE|nr:uncharacterized protein ASPWEDRAFT_166225 [Aspergillus wentii DTO 134E9]KAI9932573.1 hypothetical protein MW887_008818 [Aspergillus wentii]OJJ40139.1 hypothetical protein ASPWEDRAFT_166225 [Aspergillus wentii DTO 134E9]
MKSNKDTATQKIKQLIGENGPIKTAIFRIASLTTLLKPQQENIQKDLARVELQYSLDPQLVLDSLTALVGVSLNPTSLLNLAGAGEKQEWRLYGFKTHKDNTIAVDDPGSMKVLTTAENIQKILDKFKGVIPKSTLNRINKDLDEYMVTIQTRNEAIVKNNCCIQLLTKSLTAEEYFTKQIENLGQEGLYINLSLPSVVFWLHKVRDNLRLQVMQTLNY